MSQKINIEENNLDAIEQLLSQSVKGIHYLFDNSDIARIFSRQIDDEEIFSFDNMDKVQDLFLELIQKPTFSEKQNFLRTLDQDSYELVVRAYFHIVENTIQAAYCLHH